MLILPGKTSSWGQGGGGGLASTADLFVSSELGSAYSAASGVYNDDPPTTLASPTDDIRYWNDISGNADHQNPAAASGNTYNEDTGVPYAAIAGSGGTTMDSITSQTPFGAGGITAWAAVRPDATGQSGYFVGMDYLTRLWALRGLNTSNKFWMTIRDGSDAVVTAESTTSQAAGTDFVIIGTADTTDVRIYVNGTLETTTTNTAGTLKAGSTMTYVGGRGATLNIWSGRIYECGWINRVISASERSDLNTYLTGLLP